VRNAVTTFSTTPKVCPAVSKRWMPLWTPPRFVWRSCETGRPLLATPRSVLRLCETTPCVLAPPEVRLEVPKRGRTLWGPQGPSGGVSKSGIRKMCPPRSVLRYAENAP